MNIYYLHRTAQMIPPLVDNSRIVTLAREGLQIITSAASINGISNLPLSAKNKDNPVVIANANNYNLFMWLIDYTKAMIKECDHRGYATELYWEFYSETMAVLLENNYIDPRSGFNKRTTMPSNLDQPNFAANKALNMDYTSTNPVDLAYRKYYTARLLHRTYVEKRTTKWSKRPVPDFIKDHNELLWEVLMTFQVN